MFLIENCVFEPLANALAFVPTRAFANKRHSRHLRACLGSESPTLHQKKRTAHAILFFWWSRRAKEESLAVFGKRKRQTVLAGVMIRKKRGTTYRLSLFFFWRTMADSEPNFGEREVHLSIVGALFSPPYTVFGKRKRQTVLVGVMICQKRRDNLQVVPPFLAHHGGLEPSTPSVGG